MADSETGVAATFQALVAGLAASAMGTLQQVDSLVDGNAPEGTPAPDAAGAEAGLPKQRTDSIRTGLASARQYIDILVALQEKTKGNLKQEEEGLLSSLLTDLRIAFVKVNDRWTSMKSL